MKINGIKTFLFGTMLSGSVAVLTGCSDSGKDMQGLHDYMAEKGCTQTELNDIEISTKRNNQLHTHFARQSALDSMAYRDLFNATDLVNDSAAVANFNKIAAKAKLENVVNTHDYGTVYTDTKEAFIDILTKNSTKISIVDSLKSNFPHKTGFLQSKVEDIQNYQHYCDKYFYGKFFKDNNLTDSCFTAKFNKVAEKIQPKL